MVARDSPTLEAHVQSVMEFEVLFERESMRLFRALCLVTRDRLVAEEVAQDAFVRVYERWDRVATMEDATGYLYRTALNSFRTWRRRSAVATKRTMHLVSHDDGIAGVDAEDVVARALAPLSQRQRAAVVLIDLLGYSSEEAGAILGIRGSTVRTHVERAHQELRRWMERSDG